MSVSYDKNIYYHPEASGLTVAAELEYSDGSYQFDTRMVWRTDDGRLVTARDSGCSCPSPFEDIADVAELEAFDAKVILAEIDEEAKPDGYRYGKCDAGDYARYRDMIRGLA